MFTQTAKIRVLETISFLSRNGRNVLLSIQFLLILMYPSEGVISGTGEDTDGSTEFRLTGEWTSFYGIYAAN